MQYREHEIGWLLAGSVKRHRSAPLIFSSLEVGEP